MSVAIVRGIKNKITNTFTSPCRSAVPREPRSEATEAKDISIQTTNKQINNKTIMSGRLDKDEDEFHDAREEPREKPKITKEVTRVVKTFIPVPMAIDGKTEFILVPHQEETKTVVYES